MRAATNGEMTAKDNEKFYILSKNDNQQVGFYFETGTLGKYIYDLQAPRCYLAVPTNVASVQGFSLNDDMLTAIEARASGCAGCSENP